MLNPSGGPNLKYTTKLSDDGPGCVQHGGHFAWDLFS